MASSVTSDLPILIAGAGPAGAALAQQLRKHNVPFRIFERDVDQKARTQGWAVALRAAKPELERSVPDDLPPINTVSHLHNVGLETEVAAFDRHGKEMARWSETHGHEPWLRADRLKLRDWLITHVDVEWNKTFSRFEESERSVKVWFEDGTTAEGCALIGADGAKSRVRAQIVPGAQLKPNPFDAVFGTLTLSYQQTEEAWSQIARSVSNMQTDKTFMFLGLHEIAADNSSADWYWLMVRPHSDKYGDSFGPDAKPEKLHDIASDWAKDFPAKFSSFVERTKPKDCQLTGTFLETWSPPDEGYSTDRVTLVGDAAHKVTPLGGTGVNNALQDTFELCRSVFESESIPAAFGKYNGKNIKRSQEAVASTLKWPVMPQRFG